MTSPQDTESPAEAPAVEPDPPGWQASQAAAQLLRDVMEDQGVDIAELAERLGLSYGVVHAVLRGRNFSVSTLGQYLYALRNNVAFISVPLLSAEDAEAVAEATYSVGELRGLLARRDVLLDHAATIRQALQRDIDSAWRDGAALVDARHRLSEESLPYASATEKVIAGAVAAGDTRVAAAQAALAAMEEVGL